MLLPYLRVLYSNVHMTDTCNTFVLTQRCSYQYLAKYHFESFVNMNLYVTSDIAIKNLKIKKERNGFFVIALFCHARYMNCSIIY